MNQQLNYKFAKCILAAVVPILLLFGCSAQKAYEGSSRSSDEVAVLYGHGVSLERVNGIDISMMSGAVAVLPGSNEVELLVNASNYGNLGATDKVLKLVVNAQAGKRYSITARRGERRLCAWVIDPLTGKPDFGQASGCAVQSN